jgi:O-antigen/teichoic acid export membrane protein
MLIASVPMAALLSALAERIVLLMYGEPFRGSIASLIVLPWVLIPIFLDFPIGSLLNSTHRAHLKTAAMGIAMAVNVVANLMLVPTYGPVGAAWSGVVSFWLLFFVGWYFVHKEMALSWFGPLFLRGLGAALATWGAVTLAIGPMTDPFAFIFAAAAALVFLFLFRLLLVSDVMNAWRWLRSKVSTQYSEDEELHEKP